MKYMIHFSWALQMASFFTVRVSSAGVRRCSRFSSNPFHEACVLQAIFSNACPRCSGNIMVACLHSPARQDTLQTDLTTTQSMVGIVGIVNCRYSRDSRNRRDTNSDGMLSKYSQFRTCFLNKKCFIHSFAQGQGQEKAVIRGQGLDVTQSPDVCMNSACAGAADGCMELHSVFASLFCSPRC